MQPCSLMKKCRIQAFMCFHWGLASLLLAALSSIMYHKNELFFFCGGCKEKILRNTMFLGAWHAPLYLTLSVYPSVRPSVCLSVCLSVCRSVGLSVRRSVHPFVVCPSVHPSVRPSVRLSLIVRFFLHLSYITRLGKFLGVPTPKMCGHMILKRGGGSHTWK